MLLNCDVGEDSWESLGLQDQTSQSWRKSTLNIHWKDWYWSWNSSTLATWWEELTHWKRPWCWERLKVGGEGDDRGWDGWNASRTRWTRVWANSESLTEKEACHAALHGASKSQTGLRDWTELKTAAAAAKSLQSCPTLCDPIDGSPPGSAVPGYTLSLSIYYVSMYYISL